MFLVYNSISNYSGFLVINLAKFSKSHWGKSSPKKDIETLEIETKLLRDENNYRIEYQSKWIQNLKMLPFEHKITKQKRKISIKGIILRNEILYCSNPLLLSVFDIRNQHYSLSLSSPRVKAKSSKKAPMYILEYQGTFISNHDPLSKLLIKQNEMSNMIVRKIYKHDLDNGMSEHPDKAQFISSYSNSELVILDRELKDIGNLDFKLRTFMKVELKCFYFWMFKMLGTDKNGGSKYSSTFKEGNPWTPIDIWELVKIMLEGDNGSF